MGRLGAKIAMLSHLLGTVCGRWPQQGCGGGWKHSSWSYQSTTPGTAEELSSQISWPPEQPEEYGRIHTLDLRGLASQGLSFYMSSLSICKQAWFRKLYLRKTSLFDLKSSSTSCSLSSPYTSKLLQSVVSPPAPKDTLRSHPL